MPMYTGDIGYNHPRIKGIDRERVWEAVRRAPKLVEHPNMSSQYIHEIQDGVQCCKDYLKDPIGVSEEIYNRMESFLDSYADQRVLWCHEELKNMAVSAVPAVYELSKIDKSKLPGSWRPYVERLPDYGDFFEDVTELLSCDLCFGHKYHNQIDPRTGHRFRWTDIAVALRLFKEFRKGTNDSVCERPDFDIIKKLAASIRQSSATIGATKGSVEWQIMGYIIYQEHPLGPRRSLRTGNWSALAHEIYDMHRALETFWRGPLPLRCLQRNAARNMLFIVKLIQKSWFDSIAEAEDGTLTFVLNDDAAELGRWIAETGDWRRPQGRRSVPLCDPAGILNESSCPGLLKMDESLQWDSSQFRFDYEGVDVHLMDEDTWPQQIGPYGLVPLWRIEPERVKVVMEMWKIIDFVTDRLDLVPSMEWLFLHQVKQDLDCTILAALRSPFLYTDIFLEKVMQIAGLPNSDLIKLDFACLPQRGIVCLTSLDGIFRPGATPSEPRSRLITTAVDHIRSGRFGELNDLLRSPLIDDSVLLSENPCAQLILEAMWQQADEAILVARHDLDMEFENRLRRFWIDLSLTLRQVTDPNCPIEYDEDLCDQIIQRAGFTNDELEADHFTRIGDFGLIPETLLPIPDPSL